MDFNDSPQEAAFRAEAKAWLAAKAPAHVMQEGVRLPDTQEAERGRAWMRELFDVVLNESDVPLKARPFEYMLNALRLREGFSLTDFSARTGLPLSAIEQVGSALFSLNRFNLFSFHFADHGARDGSHPSVALQQFARQPAAADQTERKHEPRHAPFRRPQGLDQIDFSRFPMHLQYEFRHSNCLPHIHRQRCR